MTFAESLFDRHMFSTYNNEYANGLNDENEWEENLLDYDVSSDVEVDDFLMDPDYASKLYNESGYNRSRIN